ncbi:MAG: hypothetical protein GXO58_03375 [Thermodesulfobacteria bacterium]|nr:hypothetical protein [Thermodesulfobacteriota bacterium]
MSNDAERSNFGADHPKRRSRWGKKARFVCHCCKRELPFCWNCPCGFQICDECLRENMWGLSNGATWVCPDCGRVRSF